MIVDLQVAQTKHELKHIPELCKSFTGCICQVVDDMRKNDGGQSLDCLHQESLHPQIKVKHFLSPLLLLNSITVWSLRLFPLKESRICLNKLWMQFRELIISYEQNEYRKLTRSQNSHPIWPGEKVVKKVIPQLELLFRFIHDLFWRSWREKTQKWTISVLHARATVNRDWKLVLLRKIILAQPNLVV